jgi:predicted PurR-regulated permease PerM
MVDAGGRGSIGGVTTPAPTPPRVVIPRWIQLVGLPMLLLFVWVFSTAAGHVIFLFLVAATLALLFDPVVRLLEQLRLPRGLSVAFVYLCFVAGLLIAIIALASAVVGQTKSAATRFNDYFTVPHGRTHITSADRDVNRLQLWLNQNHLQSVKIEASGHRFVSKIRRRDVGTYTHRLVDFVEGAAISIGKGLFDAVLVFVISIYMLLGLPRLSERLDRRFPPHGGRPLVSRIEHSLASYVRGQLLLSLIIGATAGIGIWLLGFFGLLPGGEHYAFVFGVFVALTEVLPYIGPWLGAIPPFLYALVVHPVSALWVAILFLAIYQLEGHIVVPNVMGNALRLNPLLVIFGLLSGSAIYGLAGALMALPLLAAARATWEFFGERVDFEPWSGGGTVPVEVEPAETPAKVS